ncbi:nuclear transport factor 2 family protein [Nocardioides marmotae]|uniref:Nuclear transport factor 2 family protein n=1 Tax=Nocardioides marmotae TaxID=2663857 RepID=A0A6I3J9S9_9ACTN|nr:nuclear transport factor 2 family protein [Nocardioides marmotae]MCR6031222.1 nuclear transport factor 2 family protein [Gordonia jinghuaiqii]MBC9731938.1 nuclear transport factor 2 family protein [Nocardioides marmotae]MTB83058.1 nuclear transport factor 2 family protein [Nocardioides marmotae]MTB94860.1 nuclear transport factor 2 family protein [Nocardioides marmotae]QKE01158.1 nuclear transport factor 2 family protein [Nocardioides marmotae]
MNPVDDVAAITRLKYRYLRCLDTKEWDGFAACFAPDATADYNGLVFDDPESLVDYMRRNMGDGVLTMHQAHHPEIDVDADDPDRATGTWYLHDKVIVDAVRFALEGGATYSDVYTRIEGEWRILRTGYRRTFELTWNLDEPGGVRVHGPEVRSRF